MNENPSRNVINFQSNEDAALLLGAIVDSSDDAIISKNLNGVITSWNKSAERLFGYTAAEAIGQAVATLLIPADRQEEEPEILSRLREGERVDHFETKRKRKDGTLLDLSLTISPVRDSKGNIIGASKIARDITEQLRNREALQTANERLAQSNADLEYFTYSASHDLQEPLRMISAYSAMLSRKYGSTLDEKANQYLQYLTEGSARMERLLRDLRAFTHLSTHSGPAPEVDANAVLTETLVSLKIAIDESLAEVICGDCPRSVCTSFSLRRSSRTLLGMRFITEAVLLHISTSRRNRPAISVGFQFRTMESESPLSIRRKSLECSNDFTPLQTIPAQVWVWQSASVLSSGVEDASGWNLNSGEVRRLSLHFPQQNETQPIAGKSLRQIPLVEWDLNLPRTSGIAPEKGH